MAQNVKIWREGLVNNQKGVALLEALILVVLISLTGAAVLTLTLGGFLGSANVPASQTNKFDAMSILSRIYADLAVCDPESDGSFIVNCVGGMCTSTSDPSKCWPALGLSPPRTSITYDLVVGQPSSRDVSVRVTWCSDQYKIGIIPCDSPGCTPPPESCS